WLKRLFVITLIVLAALSALAFIQHNDQKVALDLWLFRTWPLSVGAWVLLGFILGMLLVWLLVLPGKVLGAVLIRRQGRNIDRQKAVLSNLQGETAKGM